MAVLFLHSHNILFLKYNVIKLIGGREGGGGGGGYKRAAGGTLGDMEMFGILTVVVDTLMRTCDKTT